MKEKIAVGISGGVDSMVCAKILLDQGYDVFGATMYLFDEEVDGKLQPPDFLEDAKEVCNQLGIEHVIVDLRDLFQVKVVTPFIEAYLSGQTPNPCALCNPAIKYGTFLDAVINMGASRLAIGHYANIVYDQDLNKYRIYQGKDSRKDQSFLLYGLNQWQLSKLLLPLGSVEEKAKVRELAQSIYTKIANKKDSTDICFIPNGKYYDFIKKMRPGKIKEGNFITTSGEVLGRHKGIVNYTIGQRRGLLPTLNKPMFVVDIKAEDNEVVLGKDEETYSSGFIGVDFNFIIYDEMPLNKPLKVKVCQWGYYLDCVIVEEAGAYVIQFRKPERAVAVGQAAVFHEGNEVVGGCIINTVIK